MASTRRERFVTISGKDGYFPLLPQEQDAIRIEIFFSATNIGVSNYENFDWYKSRTLYGRMKFARGEYVLKEHLIQYQNECCYTEEATLFEIVKRLQCTYQKQWEVNHFLVQAVTIIANKVEAVVATGSNNPAFDQPQPQPIEIPGLQVDGIYYSMLAGCAGKIIIQSWYDDDQCKDHEGNLLTKNNRGKPPTPQVAGKPPSGTQANVPPPDYSPGSDYTDPNPGDDVPTDTITDPTIPQGVPGGLYTVTIRDSFTASGEVRGISTLTIQGKYSALIKKKTPSGTSMSFGIQTSIGTPQHPDGVYTEFLTSGIEPNGTTTVTIEILSIVPQ